MQWTTTYVHENILTMLYFPASCNEKNFAGFICKIAKYFIGLLDGSIFFFRETTTQQVFTWRNAKIQWIVYSSISKPFFRDNSQFCTCQTKLGRTKSSKSTRKNQGWQIHEGKLTFSEECLDSYLWYFSLSENNADPVR